MKYSKVTALMAATVLAASVLSGCSPNDSSVSAVDEVSVAAETLSVEDELSAEPEEAEEVQKTTEDIDCEADDLDALADIIPNVLDLEIDTNASLIDLRRSVAYDDTIIKTVYINPSGISFGEAGTYSAKTYIVFYYDALMDYISGNDLSVAAFDDLADEDIETIKVTVYVTVTIVEAEETEEDEEEVADASANNEKADSNSGNSDSSSDSKSTGSSGSSSNSGSSGGSSSSSGTSSSGTSSQNSGGSVSSSSSGSSSSSSSKSGNSSSGSSSNSSSGSSSSSSTTCDHTWYLVNQEETGGVRCNVCKTKYASYAEYKASSCFKSHGAYSTYYHVKNTYQCSKCGKTKVEESDIG